MGGQDNVLASGGLFIGLIGPQEGERLFPKSYAIETGIYHRSDFSTSMSRDLSGFLGFLSVAGRNMCAINQIKTLGLVPFKCEL